MEPVTAKTFQAMIGLEAITRLKYLDDDASTYVRAKQDASFQEVGGGNFVVASASLACLEYLAGVHAHLFEPALMWQEQEVADWKAAKTKVRSSLTEPEARRAFDLLNPQTPKVGGHKDASRSVFNFSKRLRESGIELGLPTEEGEFKSWWQGFRNNLIHAFAPKAGYTVSGYKKSGLGYTAARAYMGSLIDVPFRINDDGLRELIAEQLAVGTLQAALTWLVVILPQSPSLGCMRSAYCYAAGVKEEELPEELKSIQPEVGVSSFSSAAPESS